METHERSITKVTDAGEEAGGEGGGMVAEPAGGVPGGGFRAEGSSGEERKAWGAKVLRQLPVDRLYGESNGVRRAVDSKSIRELAASIDMVGLLQPLVVTLRTEGYFVLAGSRRLAAVKLLGWSRVPCIVVTVAEGMGLVMSLTENVQREALSPLDEATYLLLLKEELGTTDERVATFIGKDRSYVSRRMELLGCEEEVVAAVENGTLSMTQALKLSQVEDLEEQRTILGWAVDSGATNAVLSRWVEDNKAGHRPLVQGTPAGREQVSDDAEPPGGVKCRLCGVQEVGRIVRALLVCTSCEQALVQGLGARDD